LNEIFSICPYFLVAVVSNIAIVQGETTYVVPHSPQNGPSNTLVAERIISFFDLPLWIQAAWIFSIGLGIFGLFTFWPVIVGKVKTILQNKNVLQFLNILAIIPGARLRISQKIPESTVAPRNITCLCFFLNERLSGKKKISSPIYFRISGPLPIRNECMGIS